MFGDNRGNAIPNHSKAMPFSWMEAKPIWESLKPSSFANSDNTTIVRMKGSYCLVASFIRACSCTQGRA